jgi:hypothetical protein
MNKLVSMTLCSLAAAAFGLPAAAADENTARAKAGANASVEGGAALGTTGVNTQSGGTARDTPTSQSERKVDKPKRKERAQRKKSD